MRRRGLLACALLASTPALAGPPPGPAAVLRTVGASGAVALPDKPSNDGHERSLAPYFYVAGPNPERDLLPLRSTTTEVDIAGVIASITVHQVFENHRARPIEAVYVFPASTRAAVHGMRMHVGSRVIEARIQRRQQAREAYEAARREGRRASLLEQERSNVFTTSVANVMPGDRIEVELRYTEMLVPEKAVYELVVPTVVGPRYTGGADRRTDRWMATPHLRTGRREPYHFGIQVHLQAGVGIEEVSSPSHVVDVDWSGRTRASVKLAQPGGGNKDFVLRYRLGGDQIETGLLLWDEPAGPSTVEPERFFALLVEPPRRATGEAVLPRELIFLVDVSGSMYGFPLETARSLMRGLLGNLRPTDRFNLVLFAGASHVWSPGGSRPATAESVAEAMAVLDREQGGGGTELMEGLQACYDIPGVTPGMARTVVVVTDGYVGVEARAFRFIRERLDQANLFAFGIGSSVNRALIEGMARAGQGEPFVVLDKRKAPAAAERLRRMIDRPVLTDIQVRFSGLDAYDVAPEKVPDLMVERPLLVYGKYRPTSGPARIEVTGRAASSSFSRIIDVRPDTPRAGNAALRALWARKWIELLDDERMMGGGAAVEAAITGLGLSYGVLTELTSFVAVDPEVANPAGEMDTVWQALPLPEGVPDLAVSENELASMFGERHTIGATVRTGALPSHRSEGRARGAGSVVLSARRAVAPSVIPGQCVVRGALDREIIRRIIRRHMNEVRNCYELELQKKHSLAGRVVLRFTIGLNGNVILSEVTESTLGNEAVESCIANATRSWQFPKQTGGGLVVVSYPFVLTPSALATSPPRARVRFERGEGDES